MSDRIAVMSRGRVEQIGTPEEIYSAPASVFVAGFIGSANLFPGTLDGAAAGAPVAVLDDGERLKLTSTAGAKDGDPITVMLRPERIALSSAAGRRRPQHGRRRQARDLPGRHRAADHRLRRRARDARDARSRRVGAGAERRATK